MLSTPVGLGSTTFSSTININRLQDEYTPHTQAFVRWSSFN